MNNSIFANTAANQAQFNAYAQAERRLILTAAGMLQQNILGKFSQHDTPVTSERNLQSLRATGSLLQGRPFPVEAGYGGPSFITPLQYAAYTQDADRCLVAACQQLAPFETQPNLTAVLRHCFRNSFLETAQALLFEFGVPPPADALMIMNYDASWQIATQIMAAPHTRAHVNLGLVDSEHNNVLHLLARSAQTMDSRSMHIDVQLVQLLLTHGADPRQRNLQGQLPVQLLMPFSPLPPQPLTLEMPPIDYTRAVREMSSRLSR